MRPDARQAIFDLVAERAFAIMVSTQDVRPFRLDLGLAVIITISASLLCLIAN